MPNCLFGAIMYHLGVNTKRKDHPDSYGRLWVIDGESGSWSWTSLCGKDITGFGINEEESINDLEDDICPVCEEQYIRRGFPPLGSLCGI